MTAMGGTELWFFDLGHGAATVGTLGHGAAIVGTLGHGAAIVGTLGHGAATVRSVTGRWVMVLPLFVL